MRSLNSREIESYSSGSRNSSAAIPPGVRSPYTVSIQFEISLYFAVVILGGGFDLCSPRPRARYRVTLDQREQLSNKLFDKNWELSLGFNMSFLFSFFFFFHNERGVCTLGLSCFTLFLFVWCGFLCIFKLNPSIQEHFHRKNRKL